MRWFLGLPLWAIIAAPCVAQDFAPAQARAAPPKVRPARIAAAATMRAAVSEGGVGVRSTSNGIPLLGFPGGPSGSGVLSARVPTFGTPVALTPSAIANGARLYTYTNPSGGLESVAYDPNTGATIVYDQTVSYSLQARPDFARTPSISTSSANGIIGNPSYSLQPFGAVPNSGIPIANQASPSFDLRNFPGAAPATVPTSPPPFAGTPLGNFNGGGGGPAPAPTSFSLPSPAVSGSTGGGP